ncbi:restriction endonuclease subunit S [Amycolatopsis deserti]|uniref:restriction endonuclease subunit S n=1 Tax=Amycolatopsis deserti TaxID=185696 RepID=UPI001748DDFB|nr:restriction endonuclease subunit S [Amycolatopsis deserti]
MPGYVKWWLLHSRPELEVLATGSTFAAVSTSIVGGLELPVLAPSQQRAIADYLDRETTRIDTLIEEQQRLIEMLRERREAEADELLGAPIVARHTTVKRVLRPLSRPAVPGLGVVTAFRDGVVTLRSNRREDGYTFSNTEHGYQEIRPGDLVFHALDGFAGAVGISDSHGNATPVYHVCEAVAGDHLPYVAQLLRYLGRSGFLATQAPNVRERSVDFRNWSTFGRLPLTLPPVEEQRRIAQHLDEQTVKIDTLIAETERFIELARERRGSLITAAVTGQIDVQEAA